MRYSATLGSRSMAAILLSVGASPALAQSGPAAPPASAQPVTDTGGDIVVTARKGKAERLLSVPAAISAVAGETLEQRGIRSAADYLQSVPSLGMFELSPGQARIEIRGTNAAYGEPTVGYYLDEVAFSNLLEPVVPDAGTFDIERVEVLRGPQGTLYGAGSSGGVVRVLTKQPDLDKWVVKGDVGVSGTRFSGDSNYDLNGAVNIPLIPGKLALRLGASYRELGGVLDNPAAGLKDYDPQTFGTYRAKLKAQLSDNLDVSVGAWLSRVNNAQGFGSISRTVNNVPFPETQRVDYDLYSLTANYRTSGVTITSASSYLIYDTARLNAIVSFYPFNYLFNTHNFTQEIRAASDRDGAFAWTVGGFYRDARTLVVINAPAFGIINDTARVDSKAGAVFGEGTAFLLDRKLEATVGLRYFEDHRQEGPIILNPRPKATFRALSPKFNLTYHVDDTKLLYLNVARGFRSGLVQNPTPVALALAAGVTIPTNIAPESLYSFEAGFKGSFLDRAVTVEAAAYLNKISDIQSLVRIPGTPVSGIVGGNKATVPGFELAIGLRLLRGLSIDASGSWNNARYDTASFNAFPVGAPVSLVSKWGGSLNAHYDRTLSSRASGFADFGVTYYSGKPAATFGLPVAYGRDITNARARIGVRLDTVEASVFAENLFDESGQIGASLPSIFLRPRTLGVNLRFAFGEK